MAVAIVEKRSLGALSRAGVVVAMHAAALFVFARAFGLVPGVADVPDDLVLAQVPDTPIPDDPPEPVPFKPDAAQIAQVPIPVTFPDYDFGESAITAVLTDPGDIVIDGTGSADPEPVLVKVMRDPRNPPTQPPYPTEMIHKGKEGVVEVEILVNPDGRVGEARILKSSGFSAFDNATMEEARRKWRFKPATRDGVPYAQWTRQRVVFELKNR
jgi:periplasmic protein TonB